MTEQSNKLEPNVGVSILIQKGDRLLLNKRKNTHGAGTWAPPGGYLNFGESFEDCAVRETKEETGIDITEVRFRVITNDVFVAEQKHFITVWMDAKYLSGEPKVVAPDEESELAWFTWDALPQPLFLPLQHLLEGKTYPAQTTEEKIGVGDVPSQQLRY